MKTEYLPSKQFRLRLMVLVTIVALAVCTYELVGYIQSRQRYSGQETPLAVKDLVEKDCNNNGIPDWEEALWGLDPCGNGSSNKEFITAKRQALTAGANSTVIAGSSTPENQELSQDFFSTIMSLEETGNLDDNSMQAISDAVGQKITAAPLPDTYTQSMLTIVPTTTASVNSYVAAYVKIMAKYKDANIGNELSYVNVALQDKDPGAAAIVQKIAASYRSYGKDLVAIPVPDGLASIEVSLANDYDKTGQSLEGLTQILTDPIVGMKALINYKKYNDALASDISALSDKLTGQ